MSYLLHIESSTDVCSVAISFDDELLYIVEESETLRHSEIITLLVEEVLAKTKLNYDVLSAVSLSEGPGSYTSLRVGTSAAKAICYTMNIPLVSINTLYSLACPLKEIVDSNYKIFSMIDARRNEIYGALYNKALIPIFENEPVILDDFDIQRYLKSGEKIFLTGNGAEKGKRNFPDENIIASEIRCTAKNLIKPAFFKFIKSEFSDVAYFSPNYIKPPNITTPNVK